MCNLHWVLDLYLNELSKKKKHVTVVKISWCVWNLSKLSVIYITVIFSLFTVLNSFLLMKVCCIFVTCTSNQCFLVHTQLITGNRQGLVEAVPVSQENHSCQVSLPPLNVLIIKRFSFIINSLWGHRTNLFC